ncbi:acetyl-CoA acetyltransferase [Pseudomonas resinovorans]|uniref:Acetyl-CoA acetyltransferase n=1 Tax=Metapseudomonas resinovorans TaxID=53412 RepID=A0ABT4YBK2_METRE|nr:acetyl-CoA acetyltransferase [Pseudomonas resinovorans]MDA8486274.1 acetyl-CoA acetyltransferase [Pseudomonas resinovorans]
MRERVLIAGVGVTPFTPLTVRRVLSELAGQAVRAALEDARIDYDLIDQVFVSGVNTPVGVSERVLMQVGLSGIPTFSIRDGGVSASSAVHLARSTILAGEAEAILVLGFEDMRIGNADVPFFGVDECPTDDWRDLIRRNDPLAMIAQRGHPAALFAAQMEWLQTQMGITDHCFERVLERACAQARLGPSGFADSPDRRECQPPYLCAPASGAAAILLCSEEFAARYGSRDEVAFLVSTRSNDMLSELAAGNVLDVLGRSATRRAAVRAYELAGIGVEEVDVVELHDQSVGDYLMFSSALGLCEEAQVGKFVLEANRKPVICPSGGLLGCGLVPGVSALAQMAELVHQLRGEAGARQVQGARIGLQHSASVGRSVTVSILQRA